MNHLATPGAKLFALAGILALAVVAHPTSAQTGSSRADSLVAGESSVDGEFRVRSFAWPASIREPARALRTQFTPLYPEAERHRRDRQEVRVTVLVDSAGQVVSATAWGSDAPAAFDTSSVRAARAWTWEPSLNSRALRTLAFQFDGRPQSTDVGSVLLVVRDSVSGVRIEGIGLTGPAKDAGVLSFAEGWIRIRDVPAGESKLVVHSTDFAAKEVAIRVVAGLEDTVTVLLSPVREIPEGHTFWTHPPASYPQRAVDDSLRAATDFAFVFEMGPGRGHGTKVDSRAGTVKVTSGLGSVVLPIRLTKEELERIRRSLIDARFFDDLQPPRSDPNRFTSHDGHYFLEATLGGWTRAVSWKWSSADMSYPSDDWKRLRNLIWLVEDILEERPEYVAQLRR